MDMKKITETCVELCSWAAVEHATQQGEKYKSEGYGEPSKVDLCVYAWVTIKDQAGDENDEFTELVKNRIAEKIGVTREEFDKATVTI